MSTVTNIATAKRESLFGKEYKAPLHYGTLIDAICYEVSFAYGIEAALNGIEVIDGARMEGAKELVRAHIDRLEAVGRLAERLDNRS
jgi:hypothetical protein